MDFYNTMTIEKKNGTLQIRPDWIVGRSKDLMTRSGTFYAIWDEERGLWSKDIYDVQRLVDADLMKTARIQQKKTGVIYDVAQMSINSTKLWDEFQRYIRNSGTNSVNLDENLIFANTEVKRTDYASKRLPYSLNEGPTEAWDTIVGTLYNEEERAKIEWAIGAIVSGDSKSIQKFLVFYGPPASGKSTILNIIEKLFQGYTAVFDARELAANNNSFATSAFKSNPLVAIQHDGDLSRIYDNTKLNSIVAHEIMSINEKYKAAVDSRSNAFLFMGTNLPVKISDAKSGILRRLIDVVPTQKVIEHDTYHILMDQINFELGAIAKKCLDVYKQMGKNYYSAYRPTEMMLQTDVFYNFVEANFDIFKAEDGITLKRAWELYKTFCSDTGIDKVLPQYKLREELKNYFYRFEERVRIDGVNHRSYYSGFKNLRNAPQAEVPIKPQGEYDIELKKQTSIFDAQYPGLTAQYANDDGIPAHKWINVSTVLSDLDTERLHYVKMPENHIVIDFDLTDEDGNKSLERNLGAAKKFPPTYTETSKSGQGLHLHYIYTGDVRELASIYDIGVEIKRFTGDSSLRRQLTVCNDMNITPMSGGLPTREVKPVISNQSITTEKGLRDLIIRNLRKEIHAGTKPSVDFIHHILEEAYNSGMSYDVTDLRSDIFTFAARSTNQAAQSIKLVQSMHFTGQSDMVAVEPGDGPIVFFDVEVYPNLLVVCWKEQDSPSVVRMINPEPKEIEGLFAMKLVGFNNRRYDNHILYARYLGHTLEQVYNLSQKLINTNEKTNYFGEAYNISYTDIYDFSSKKQGLKKFMIEYDVPHMELDIPWDQPVDEGLWDKIVEYCVNDVLGTETVFEKRSQDFAAREILAEISGLSVNHTTQAHTAKIIFGNERSPQKSFVYTDLSELFPGYEYNPKEGSTYRGEITGEGGYVYAQPGIYENVALLDVASMHPTSIELLNLFGPYTERFSELKEARMAIKRKDDETASGLLGGKLAKFVGGSDADREALSYALKIVINIVYGLTSARFENAFRDNRNVDNIVAKRGALFMIDLKHFVQDKGYEVVHIKTDSIKVPIPKDAPRGGQEIIDLITNFGKDYGYDFEHECTYDKFILVNDAVYVARADGKWTAVGAQFQHPYVYKTLFSGESVGFQDFCETKNVTQGTMYLDFVGSGDLNDMVHVGRTGSFVPVKDEGGTLWRIKDDLKYAVTGTKGYSWITRDVAKGKHDAEMLNIDYSYFEDLKAKAIEAIMQFEPEGDFAQIIS